MTTWIIYALVDPHTGEPRYVGQTRQTLKLRLRGHLRERSNTHKGRWLAKLSKENLKPVMRHLYECYDGKTADSAEIFYIADFKDRGFALTNHAGGGGNGCLVYDLETRAKISAAKKGRKLTPEHVAKMSEARKGKKLTMACRAKMSEVRRGKKGPKVSAETRAKISEALKRRWLSLTPERRDYEIKRNQEGRRVKFESLKLENS